MTEYKADEDLGSFGTERSNDPERMPQEHTASRNEECRWFDYES